MLTLTPKLPAGAAATPAHEYVAQWKEEWKSKVYNRIRRLIVLVASIAVPIMLAVGLGVAPGEAKTQLDRMEAMLADLATCQE